MRWLVALDGMSAALDLVEEFRSLGEIEEDANGVVGPKSIGERNRKC